MASSVRFIVAVLFFPLFPSAGISDIRSYTEYSGKTIYFAIAVYSHAVSVVMSAIGSCGINTKLFPALLNSDAPFSASAHLSKMAL